MRTAKTTYSVKPDRLWLVTLVVGLGMYAGLALVLVAFAGGAR